MWLEIFSGIGGGLITFIGTLIHKAYLRGKDASVQHRALIDLSMLEKVIEEIKKEISEIKLSHAVINRDYVEMKESVQALNENIDKNNQMLASANATLGGLDNLVRMILTKQIK